MYRPIPIDKVREARRVIDSNADDLNHAGRGMADVQQYEKQNRTACYKLYCQLARKAAQRVLDALPSDEYLDTLIK